MPSFPVEHIPQIPHDHRRIWAWHRNRCFEGDFADSEELHSRFGSRLLFYGARFIPASDRLPLTFGENQAALFNPAQPNRGPQNETTLPEIGQGRRFNTIAGVWQAAMSE
jgi:hypothetical protein